MPVKDEYVNQAYLSVTESGLNTLTFKKLETGVSIYEKVGWLINRLDYTVSLDSGVFAADGDTLTFGISVMSSISTIDLSNDAIIDFNQMARLDLGTASSGLITNKPLSKDFSNLKGGGILVPPNPIYIYAKGASLGAAQTVSARMFYTVISLKAEDFWELVEQRRMISTG